MKPDEVLGLAARQNQRMVKRLASAQTACCAIVASITLTVLTGWLVPVVGSGLPAGWSVMKANSALALLLSAASLMLTQPARTDRQVMTGRACAALVLVLATTAILGHLTGRTLGLETVLAADQDATRPGRMSLQTSSFLLTLGLALAFGGPRQKLRTVAGDLLTGGLVVIPLVSIAAYSFGAPNFFSQADARTSPQTLICISLLAFSAFVRRTHKGFFSILVGIGIGSQMARLSLPFALLMPFLIICGGAYTALSGRLSFAYSAALTAAATSMMSSIFVMLAARRINELERGLRDLSLTDELTQLHNLRSFYILGEHMFREGRRDVSPVGVLYFDVDGLKAVNDRFGHDVGSQLVVAFADLLRTNFRATDVVARVGGDEFAVVTKSGKAELMNALQRLERATTAANLAGNKPFQISYSVGEAIAEPSGGKTFAELVDSADIAMYVRKHLKRTSPNASTGMVRPLVSRAVP